MKSARSAPCGRPLGSSRRRRVQTQPRGHGRRPAGAGCVQTLGLWPSGGVQDWIQAIGLTTARLTRFSRCKCLVPSLPPPDLASAGRRATGDFPKSPYPSGRGSGRACSRECGLSLDRQRRPSGFGNPPRPTIHTTSLTRRPTNTTMNHAELIRIKAVYFTQHRMRHVCQDPFLCCP